MEDLPAIRAAALYAAFDENAVAAEQEWKGKRVVVTGIVGSIDRELLGRAYVILDSDVGLDGVQCVFPQGEEAGVADLRRGQEVTVLGRVQGKVGNVQMDGCELHD